MPISFDRVADIYDETRRMPDEVVRRIVELILQEVDPAAGPMLEIGIGTGRIALPLAERGVRIAGIDLSEKMLAHLREKCSRLPIPPRIARGDIMKLPFRTGMFQAILAVHVFHLIGDLRGCLMEIRRVLRPGGRLLFGGEPRQLRCAQQLLLEQYGDDITDLLEMFEECGVKLRDQDEVDRRVNECASELGARIERLPAVEWDYEITCGDFLARINGRVTSSLWNIPEDSLKKIVGKFATRLERAVGPPSTMLRFRRSFRLMSARFPG